MYDINTSFNEMDLELSPIQRFFMGKSVFITGGSGFLGKILIEKLLRSCPGVNKIYLLIRSKKGKNVEERMTEILDDVLFKLVREKNPKFHESIVAIPGDCSIPGMGITEEHRKLLTENVNVVIHAAATVRFDENLKKAIMINVNTTQEIINMCHEMKYLESFVHVSTAYAFCYLKNIEEEVCEWSPRYEEALALSKELTESEIQAKTNDVLGAWPNTYTFTKALAEGLVMKLEGLLPVCIFRPGIVTATVAEPFPGWVDNMLGPTGIILGAGCGVVRAVHCNGDLDANLVPVDLVINGILASAYETNRNFRDGNKKIKVYNFVASAENSITFEHFASHCRQTGLNIPSIQAMWYYSLILCKSELLTYVLTLVLHWLPAFLVDTALVISGRKPKLVKTYSKVHKMIRALSYFTTTQWNFKTRNIQDLWDKQTELDQKQFNFDVRCIDWESYVMRYVSGMRQHILKEDMSNLAEARKRWKRLYWYHQTLKLVIVTLILTVSWFTINKTVKVYM